MIKADDEDPDDRVGNAIELAIIGHAKRFIKSNAAQRVINSIWRFVLESFSTGCTWYVTSGQCVYQPVSNHSILPDTYKRTPVHFYDPHKAPLLDHYRFALLFFVNGKVTQVNVSLKVPAIRSAIEYSKYVLYPTVISRYNNQGGFSFLILFLLFVWALEKNEVGYLNVPEMTFMIYAFGFALEKVASMQEHGIRVYFTGDVITTQFRFFV
jgi:hypothetical protein